MSYSVPGRPFAYMWHLLSLNFQVLGPTPIGTELMLAVFWEEGPFFNNGFQVGAGTAVGFGQTEPVEFYRFDAKATTSEAAKAGGYLVHNLPPRVRLPPFKPGGRPRAKVNTPLDDYTSVRVACAFVRDLFERGIRSKQSILNAYGGVGFQGPQPKHLAERGGREGVIQGWLKCEAALMAAHPKMEPRAVLEALRLAKPFDKSLDPQYLKILFPDRVVLEFE